MEKNKIKLKKKTIKNDTDVDIFLRDAYGEEHIVFPKEEKTIYVLEIDKKTKR